MGNDRGPFDTVTPVPSAIGRPGGVLAIWGSSDLPGLGDQLLARVARSELAARLPDWSTRILSPTGRSRPTVADGGVATDPIADGADLAVVVPAFPLDQDLADRYGELTGHFPSPAGSFAWSGARITSAPTKDLCDQARRALLLTVRDSGSAELLRAAGVGRRAEVVPHPGLALDRVVDIDTLPERARQLRQLGYLPARGDFAVIAAVETPSTDLIRRVEALTALPALVLPVGPSPIDESITHGLVMEDRLAVLAAATVVVATDEHSAAAAAALGGRWIMFDPLGSDIAVVSEFADTDRIATTTEDLAGALRAADPVDIAGPRRRLVSHYNAIGALVEKQTEGTESLEALAAENASLRIAHARLRERMLVERQRLAEPLAEALTQRERAMAEAEILRAENAALLIRAEHAESLAAAAERELEAWRNTKLVRWSTPLREVYAKAARR